MHVIGVHVHRVVILLAHEGINPLPPPCLFVCCFRFLNADMMTVEDACILPTLEDACAVAR